MQSISFTQFPSLRALNSQPVQPEQSERMRPIAQGVTAVRVPLSRRAGAPVSLTLAPH